jgi:hypothetical protein
MDMQKRGKMRDFFGINISFLKNLGHFSGKWFWVLLLLAIVMWYWVT